MKNYINLIPAFKRRTEKKTTTEGSPLQIATFLSYLIMNQQWDALSQNVSSNPEIVKETLLINEKSTISFRFPLHEACRYKPTTQVVKMLILAHPEALHVKDSMYGFLPIHFACRYGASEKVVEELLRAFPKSIHVKDKYGCTPIHLARRSSYEHKDSVLEVMQKEIPNDLLNSEKITYSNNTNVSRAA